jgi:hypothetical protein
LKDRTSDPNAEPDLPKSDLHCRRYKLSHSEDQKRITHPEPNHIFSIRPIEAAQRRPNQHLQKPLRATVCLVFVFDSPTLKYLEETEATLHLSRAALARSTLLHRFFLVKKLLVTNTSTSITCQTEYELESGLAED